MQVKLSIRTLIILLVACIVSAIAIFITSSPPVQPKNLDEFLALEFERRGIAQVSIISITYDEHMDIIEDCDVKINYMNGDICCIKGK